MVDQIRIDMYDVNNVRVFCVLCEWMGDEWV